MLSPLFSRWLLASLLWLAGCNVWLNVGGEPTPPPDPDPMPPRYQPARDVRWQLQLQGAVTPQSGTQLLEIDLFDTPESQLITWRRQGIRLLCYFSAGTLEIWRPDVASLPASVRGEPLPAWPGEYWLDVRASSVRDLMRSRLDLAQRKGCDAVDADNVDGFLQNSGFALNASDQLDYNRFLAHEAHRRGLAIALKNNLTQIADLVADFDLAVNEQCHAYQECVRLAPFVRAGKPVLNIEYDPRFVADAASRRQLCDEARQEGLQTRVLTPALDGTLLHSCF